MSVLLGIDSLEAVSAHGAALHMGQRDGFSLLRQTCACMLPKHFGNLRPEVASSRPARATYQDFVSSNLLIPTKNQTIHAVFN